MYQESVDIGKHNPDNDYIATTTQGNEMTKVQKISEMLLDAIATTRSISEGFDKIMGEGAYEKLASDLYDALRAA